MDADQPTVGSGQVAALRLVDIAYEIDLRLAEELWAKRGAGASARSRLGTTPSKAIAFGIPPLKLEMGPVPIQVAGQDIVAAADVRLYDFGVAAFALRIPIRSMGWQAFTQFVNSVDAAVGPTAQTGAWQALLERLREALKEALDRPSAAQIQEDYLLASVDRLDPPMQADDILAGLDLAPLLAGETRPLSDGARADLLRHRFSYFRDDLVVLTWDRAFILEPRRETDVADVLEMANAQLLEMRTYDEMLDEELPRMRALVEAARNRTSMLAAGRYSRLAQRLHALVGEVTELTERVDNALQVTEDVYLARVYAAAMEVFRVASVGAAVDRKLAIIRDTYTALHGDAAGSRAEVLEIAILLLIAVEIVLSLVRH